MKEFIVTRKHDTVTVLLLPHKDGSSYSYVNLTKGHICPCVFKTVDAAIADMASKPDVIHYEEVDYASH